MFISNDVIDIDVVNQQMNHAKIVDAVKAQREVASNAFAEINRLKSEAFEKIESEKQAIKEQEADLNARIKAEKQAMKEQASRLRESAEAVLKA